MLSQALYAQFADAAEQRASDRRVLRLEAQVATPSGEDGIQIHNLSRTGMLVESTVDVAIGTLMAVEMPGGARHSAEVVWRDAELFGCRFAKPLSQAALSAALLRATPAKPVIANNAVLVDSDAMARLRQHWNFEHELVDIVDTRLPIIARAWVIVTLALASWVIPVALTGWLVG